MQTTIFRNFEPFVGNDDQGQFLSLSDREDKLEKNIEYNTGGEYGYGDNVNHCSYQEGCFPMNPRRFESQACTPETDRICLKCSSCIKGEEYIKHFCGEKGDSSDKKGGSSDTVCSPCTICGEKEFKVEGCTLANRTRDTICNVKTICKGRKTEELDDIYDITNIIY